MTLEDSRAAVPPSTHQNAMDDASGTPNEERDSRSASADQEDHAPPSGTEGETATRHPTFVHQIAAPTAKPKRARKSAVQRKASKGGKRGNPGLFVGEDGAYLSSLLKDYVSARDVLSRGRGKNTKLDGFWSCMIAGFWERFQWTSYARDNETKEETIERINTVSRTHSVDNDSVLTGNLVYAELD